MKYFKGHQKEMNFNGPSSGACLQVSPSSGTLSAGARQTLTVRLLANTWGLYHDQILLQVRFCTRYTLNLTQLLMLIVSTLWPSILIGPKSRSICDSTLITEMILEVSIQT